MLVGIVPTITSLGELLALCISAREFRLILVPPLYRGELSFLQPVHFCICWHDRAILNGYLFLQWLACVHVPNWENVLGVSAVYGACTDVDIPPIGMKRWNCTGKLLFK